MSSLPPKTQNYYRQVSCSGSDESVRLLPHDELARAYQTRSYEGRLFSTFPSESTSSSREEEKVTAINWHSKISVWEASWCINNIIQGLPVIGLPFTLLQAGYWALVEIVVFGAISCYTGKLLVDCLYDVDEFGNRVRVRQTYSEVAAVCLGRRLGPALVTVALLAELFMICTLFVIICGDLLASFGLASLSVRHWILITGIFVLLYAFLRNIKHAAWISTICMVIHCIMVLVVLGYCFSKTNDWKLTVVELNPSFQGIALAAGVILTSNMGHVIFPITEGNMVEPESFWPMLKWTYFLSSILKFVFAYFPFLTFGEDTQGEVTNNLPTTGQMRNIVNVLIIFRGLLSYSMPYITMVEIINDHFFAPIDADPVPAGVLPSCFVHPGTVQSQDDQPPIIHHPSLKWWAIIARMGAVLLTVLVAFAMPYFDIIAGLFVSIFGSLIAIIWPCLFHIKLYRSSLSWPQLAVDSVLVVFGVIYGITGFIFSVSALSEQYMDLFN